MTSRRHPGLILALVFVLALPAVTTRIYASDEVQFFSWLRSLAFDRDVDFQNEYQHFYDNGTVQTALFHETFLEERRTPAGHRLNFTPVGCALLWAPFYAVGHLVALTTGAPRDGFSQPYISAVAYGSAVYGGLALLLSMSIARRLSGQHLLATFAIWIGTPLVFYMYVAPPFSHACSAFAVALFLWTWLRIRDHWTPAGAIALGLTGALMAMVRDQDVFFVAGPALDFLRDAFTTRAARDATRTRRFVTAAATGTIAFIALYSLQALAAYRLNGHPGVDESVARKMTWTAPHGFEVLFSAEHGLFAWTPLAPLAIAGLAALALGLVRASHAPPASSSARDVVGDTRWVATLGLLMVLLQAYVSGSVESWSVAGAFGQRRFVALTPLLVAGLAAVLTARGRLLYWTTRVAIVLCIWWNIGLMLQFSLNEMDRQGLTLAANARATFVDLPRRAPDIVWRYFADRSSFYKRPRP